MATWNPFRRGARTKMSKPSRNVQRTGSTTVRAASKVDEQHLQEFVAERRGVEGFVEPRTAVSEVTLLLVAHDGEWTRRRVPSVSWAHDFCNHHQVPSYDAGLVGIPQRMREWNSREKMRLREQRQAEQRRLLGDD